MHQLFVYWVIFHALNCCLLTFFSKLTFFKNLPGILSGCQIVWIQIRTHIVYKPFAKVISRGNITNKKKLNLLAFSADNLGKQSAQSSLTVQ